MITFLIVLVCFAVVLELLSLRDNLSNIRYHCVPSKWGCEPGEEFQLITKVSNYGRRTISFLKIQEILPEDIHIQGVEKKPSNDKRFLYENVLYIRGKQKITRKMKASIPHRGRYLFEGCKLHGGDFLGIREISKELVQQEEIIIFPKKLEDKSIQQALAGYYGDFSVKRFYLEDPILVTSYRDYTGREPMRSISWMQSAKKNHLMVKEFDYTMDLSVTIILDVCLHWSEATSQEEIEYCFSLARTIAEYMETKKVSYRLLTNAYNYNGTIDYQGLSQAGQGAHHYTMFLHALGQANGNPFCTLDELLELTINHYSGENAIFYVAPFENEARSNMVQQLQQRCKSQVYPMYSSVLMGGAKDVD